MITTILFDIGSTILYEEDIYSALLEKEKEILNQYGYAISERDYIRIIEECVLSGESNLIRSVAWRYTKPDKEMCERIIRQTRSYTDELIKIYPRKLMQGIDKVLAILSEKYTLSLAGNASTAIKNDLKNLNVLHFFSCTDVSDDIKISKPSVDFFKHYLTKLNVNSDEVIFIGDRLDNDIIPAKSLGIKTIWYKNGFYKIMQPLSQNEMPDAVVENSFEIVNAVKAIVQGSNYMEDIQ